MEREDEIMRRLGYYEVRPDSRHNPTEEELADFESQIGGPLPPDYRRFLSKYGGTAFEGRVGVPLREPSPWGDSCEVEVFYGFTSDPSSGIVYETMETYSGRIPDETVPAAYDPFGNLILVGFEGVARDRVWFWDHEHRELAGRIDEMVDDLRAKGVDVDSLDDHAVIWHWEELFPERLTKPPRHGNIYAIADSFNAFLESLRPIAEDPEEDSD
ncbi:MAG: SMI1/KNR4 family protein [Acidobacteria bacterium]|nr:SMI1/KNR4 family protein [Acidobacteriota bacterium]